MSRSLPALLRSPSTDEAVRAATGGRVRVLADADTPALAVLTAQDPVVNVFVSSVLETGRGAGPRGGSAGTLFLGVDDDAPGVLRSAAWVGSNVIPVVGEAPMTEADAEALAAAAVVLRRRFGSVYGPAAPVMTIGRALRGAGHRPRSVREEQPLLLAGERLGAQPSPAVRPARPAELERVVPASAAMFEEELGFSPYRSGAAQYRDRVRRLVEAGRVLVDPGEPEAPVHPLRFKADLGVVSAACAQIQGVWVHPDHRGRGLAAPAMAAVVEQARRRTPLVSLYVNAFNTRALRTYERVGFERVGTFATVLY